MGTNKRRKGRPVHGILLLNKPLGMSSNAALQRIKRIFNAQKAGHTGSLDPLASGLLPLCFGEATKFSQYLLSADKSYRVCAQLGVRTTTGDAEGEVVSTRAVPTLTQASLDQTLDRFRGNINQVPSMYSALKHQGQPLYKLARQGITVERPSRPISIHRLEIIKLTADLIYFEMHCSKGTYVRTLVDDLGEALGSGAHVKELMRFSVGPYQEKDMISIESLEQLAEQEGLAALDQHLLTIESALGHFPKLALSTDLIFYLRQGNPILVPHAPTTGWVCLTDQGDKFIGVGEVLEDGKIAPRRLIR